jgi:hypothetical protein
MKAHARPARSLATVVLAAMLWTPLASAAAALEAALQLERELAVWADTQGIRL